MPIYKSIMVSAHTQVYLWKVTEAEKDLAKGIELTDPCHQRMQAMKSELHRRAFLSIRHLLGKAGYEDKDLYYNDFGKPHLRDGNHVSITHSNHFTGIIIGRKEEVGIDIERQREKILRIAHIMVNNRNIMWIFWSLKDLPASMPNAKDNFKHSLFVVL